MTHIVSLLRIYSLHYSIPDWKPSSISPLGPAATCDEAQQNGKKKEDTAQNENTNKSFSLNLSLTFPQEISNDLLEHWIYLKHYSQMHFLLSGTKQSTINWQRNLILRLNFLHPHTSGGNRGSDRAPLDHSSTLNIKSLHTRVQLSVGMSNLQMTMNFLWPIGDNYTLRRKTTNPATRKLQTKTEDVVTGVKLTFENLKESDHYFFLETYAKTHQWRKWEDRKEPFENLSWQLTRTLLGMNKDIYTTKRSSCNPATKISARRFKTSRLGVKLNSSALKKRTLFSFRKPLQNLTTSTEQDPASILLKERETNQQWLKTSAFHRQNTDCWESIRSVTLLHCILEKTTTRSFGGIQRGAKC